jgi:hypothetical protein|tara:strand:+ start:829 stop:1263 length:435 start_codon:yes stop_codon:yes gene_type:complete
MQARKWDLDKDYSILRDWCKERNWDTPMPKEVLPVRGIVIEDGVKQVICAAGLYIDEKSKFGFMYGIFSRPRIGKIKLFKAMKMCVEGIKKEAKNNKLSLVYTITGENSLNKLYTKYIDMKLCENNVKSYIMNLKNYKNLDWLS